MWCVRNIEGFWTMEYTRQGDGICSHNSHLSWLSVGLTLGDGVASQFITDILSLTNFNSSQAILKKTEPVKVVLSDTEPVLPYL